MALLNMNAIIKELISYTNNNLSIDNYTSENLAKAIGNNTLIEELINDRSHYWQDFLNFLSSEQNSGQLGHYFVRANDIRTSSVYDFIQANADLDQNGELFEELFENYIDYIKGTMSDFKLHWNESINNLVTYFINHYFWHEIGISEEYTYGLETVDVQGVDISWRIADIKNGDAGASFDFSTENGESLVIPGYNIDKDTFYKVEKSNIILSVVNKERKLQFTRTQHQDRWFRLLMPQNNRRVEVIDHNRNFWVIAQGIAAVSEKLFNPNNPTFNFLFKILNELVQLWENVMFLWALMALWWAAKHTSKTVQVEFITLPNDIFQPTMKYDNFSTAPTMTAETIAERLEYLIDLYPKSNLCIIPIIRYNNYKSNYYTDEAYPYIFFHPAGTKGFTHLNLRFSATNRYANFNVDDFSGFKLYGMQDLGNGRAYYGYPFERIGKTHEDNPKGYYAALRVVPEVSASIDSGVITINSFKFKVYDAVRETMTLLPRSATTLKKTYTKADGTWTSANDNGVVYMSTSDQGTDKTRRAIFTEQPMTCGLYKGELATSFTKSVFIPFEFDVIQIPEVEFQPSAAQVNDVNSLLTYAQNSLTQGWDGHTIEEDEEERHKYFYVFTSKRGSLDAELGTSQTYSYIDTNALNQGQRIVRTTTTRGSADFWITGCVLYDPFKQSYIAANPHDQMGFVRLKGIQFGGLDKTTFELNGYRSFENLKTDLYYFPGLIEAAVYDTPSYNASMSWSVNDSGWDFLSHSYVTDETHYMIQGMREYSDAYADSFNGSKVVLYRSIIVYNPRANTLEIYNKTPQQALNTQVESVGLINKNHPSGPPIYYEWGYTSIAKVLLDFYYNRCYGATVFSPDFTFDYTPYPSLRYRVGFYYDSESTPYYTNQGLRVRPV